MIKGFKEEHRFLSNFWPAPLMFDGIQWPCVENAYQWYKNKNYDDLEKFQQAGPGVAKKYGKAVKPTEDFKRNKVGLMKNLVSAKFFQNPELAKLLLDTGDEYILEWNNWGDDFWGVVDVDEVTVQGTNHLGEILMQVRGNLRGEGLIF